jgi:Cu+-exporting ATPase
MFFGQRASQGKTSVFVAEEGRVIGLLALLDVPRASADKAVDDLKAMGLQVAMITGDNEKTARGVGNTLGIDQILAEVLPGDKAEEIRRLQARGQIVAMVGDGINDAPALTTADIGIAIRSRGHQAFVPDHANNQTEPFLGILLQ